MEEPACTAGRMISPNPARGPLDSRRRVVADLRQLDRHALQHAGEQHKGTHVGGRLDEVRRRNQRFAGQPAELLDGQSGVSRIGVDAGADRRGAEVHLAEQGGALAEARDVLLQRGIEGVELLAKRHRNRVLELRAADLQHVREVHRLGLEGVGEFVERPDERLRGEDDREPQGRGIGIVGRLRHVDVVVGMQGGIVAFRPPHDLQRDIGHDLVGVHVG